MAQHRRPMFRTAYFIPTSSEWQMASIRAGFEKVPVWPYRVDHLADIPRSKHPATHKLGAQCPDVDRS